MGSPIIWFGGKSKITNIITRYMPQHTCFVDLFGGGGSVTADKQPSTHEVFNDIDKDLVNFLLVLRRQPERLASELDSLPYSRALYEEWKWAEKPEDKFEAAVRWFYINRSAVAAGNNHKSGWRHGKDANPAKDFHSAIAALKGFASRFRNVQIECRDFREIIKTYDSHKTLFYVDPPYVGNERRYKGGFTEKDHVDLADMLEAIQGRAIVSYYDCDLVQRLYGEWRRVEIETFTTSRVERGGEARAKRTELLLMSWDDPQATIWDAIGELA